MSSNSGVVPDPCNFENNHAFFVVLPPPVATKDGLALPSLARSSIVDVGNSIIKSFSTTKLQVLSAHRMVLSHARAREERLAAVDQADNGIHNSPPVRRITA